MENEEMEAVRKRMKTAMEENEGVEGGGAVEETTEEEETGRIMAGSEEIELNITHVLERIERFTQLVSELLESGKTLFKELSNEFEERMITIHKDQMEKWQEEIKELRSLDASNEEASALLHNAQYLLQNVRMDS
ncbi:hypothetical protein HHK36_020990 [Tetracentron sinense]|uniref:Knotted 1-binding protein 36 n=1 Tax=Tetracentron sinense TaxID=13715 RepID=A0A834YV10_TETSI|nr:hypothetical protein HHK36_020990 [Tetracentron sinense]